MDVAWALHGNAQAPYEHPLNDNVLILNDILILEYNSLKIVNLILKYYLFKSCLKGVKSILK